MSVLHEPSQTPTTADVRSRYATSWYEPFGAASADARDAFDRWLSAHDSEVAAQALRDQKEAHR
ncbi:hypothetical protein [Brachybacterium kimchii]|uniref:DUF4880 domain-containing protein n=1 Tax=Brachybacterium kimchii TaxID=2942909 RepID=A0ABY4N7Z7_9MICO|nr:hypothetical protein [Brachybacterium kimchii]UQN30678.1 hypothetical protein M4486_05075 [Brachybacterium kimchii]